MPRKNSFFVLVLILSFFICSTSGYSWGPFGNKKEKKSAAPVPAAPGPAKASAVATPVTAKKVVSLVTPAAVRAQDLEDEELAEEEDEEVPLIPELPEIPKIPNVRPVVGISATVSGIPPAANFETPGRDPEIDRIKKQIQDIIKINESLKFNYAGQAAEIQKISEQAKIHQRLLKDLEAAKTQQETAARPSSEKYLNEEKIRLIQKETEKNQKFLDTLQAQEVSKGIAPAVRPDQEARKS